MSIQIVSHETNQENGTTYKFSELAIESKSILITSASGRSNYISIVVNNAAHKVWRGLGRQFDNFEAAAASYKDAKIKSLILAAQQL